MSALVDTLPVSGYWSKHTTIVITWPGDMPGVAAIGRHHRNADGSLSVEYTREDLELALAAMREVARRRLAEPPISAPSPTPTPTPEPARLVFGRMSQREARRLARQAEPAQAQQEALL